MSGMNAFNINQSQTDQVLIAAVTGKKILITGITVLGGSIATAITFGSKVGAGTTTPISPQYNLPVSGGFARDNDSGIMQTAVSEGLVVTTGAGATVAVQITWRYAANQ